MNQKSGLVDDLDLIEKYDVYAFDYIEYPHKSFWSEKFTEKDYQSALKDTLRDPERGPFILYVHIPFCQQMCWFCLCRFEITHNYERVKNYLKVLYREIDRLHEFLEKNALTPNFKEVHLGGGSPTYLREEEFGRLKEKLATLVDFENLAEFAIEIDPRRVDKSRMNFYHEQGINRISFGVQDFDLEVQKAVNRVQPPELLEPLLSPEVRSHFQSVNFDLLCGLPKQTVETMRKTIDQVIEFSPDRIALSFMHYNPQRVPHQQMLKKNGDLPNFHQRKAIFQEAVASLLRGGYVRTGYEHFARPADEVAKAVETENVQYNSLGATPGRCSNLIGLGLHSYSRIGDFHYAQNVYEEHDYENVVGKGRFPVFRGHKLNQDDLIRRHVIHRLRSLFNVSFRELREKFGVDFREYFSEEQPVVEEFARDGMLEISDRQIALTETGKHFSNLACKIFDYYSRGPQYPEDFFKAPKVIL